MVQNTLHVVWKTRSFLWTSETPHYHLPWAFLLDEGDNYEGNVSITSEKILNGDCTLLRRLVDTDLPLMRS